MSPAILTRTQRPGEEWIILSDNRVMIVHNDRAPIVLDIDLLEPPADQIGARIISPPQMETPCVQTTARRPYTESGEGWRLG